MTTRHTTPRRLAAGLGLLALATLTTPAARASDEAYYHDGERRVALQLQADLVADFGARRATTLAASPLAQAPRVAGDSTVRILRVGSGARDAAAAGTDRSPVFRQGGSAAGRLMALPGGVLVKFRPDWRRDQADQWLAAHGLPAARPLGLGAGWALVPTAPGLAALDTANRLHATGELLSASPNWWTQTAAK